MFILLKVKRTNLVHLPDDTQPYFKLCVLIIITEFWGNSAFCALPTV